MASELKYTELHFKRITLYLHQRVCAKEPVHWRPAWHPIGAILILDPLKIEDCQWCKS